MLPSSPPLSLLTDLFRDQTVIILLVFTRLSGLVIAAPIFGSRSVPVRIRALLVLALTMLIAPMQCGVPLQGTVNVVVLAALLAQEILVGLALGLGIAILLSGLQLSGHLASHMSGMALADVFDPSFDTSVPVFARVLDLVTVAVFVAIGGHRMLMKALLDTFQWMPPGRASISSALINSLGELLTQSFVLAVRAAAPMVLALLLSMLVMGLVSRTLPQLNIFAIGFSLNSTVMLATMAISLGSIAWIFQDEIEPALQVILEMFAPNEAA